LQVKNYMIHKKSIEIGGKIITLETGRVAKQANGAVFVSLNESMSLCTVVAKDEPEEGRDFFPLMVDYREKSASAGKIPGGFFKREGKPSEKEILSARLVDRPIRPMFPEGFICETQININVYSADGEHDADVISTVGASAALLISDIPFDEAVSEVRITRLNGEFIFNPTYKQCENGDFEIFVAGTEDSIVMVEGEAKEISEEDLIDAIKFAHQHIKILCKFQKDFASEAGKPKRNIQKTDVNDELINDIKNLCADEIKELNRLFVTKEERKNKIRNLFEKVKEELDEKYPESEEKIKKIIEDIQYEDMRRMILDEQKRLDGRDMKDIRPINCEISVLPRTHGSALFTRGETQSLTTLTLGTKSDEQIVEGFAGDSSKRFILHYNFPSFSTGEVSTRFGPGRREIGHGNLAERALKNLIPGYDEFPYTIRIVSDILESNGSSSMATVCAGSLALMDGGINLKKTVAGIAMGLIKENDKVVILSDILGTEDHFGDMDFKIAGTVDGITAVQMDIKIRGISFEIMEKALEQAKEGRLSIIDIMNQTISKPRESISKYAPHLYTINIPVDRIGDVIGPGGKTIRNIIAQTNSEIDIEEDGKVTVAAISKEDAQKAIAMIEDMTQVPVIGKVYEGTVKSVKDFGAFVEIFHGKEGLLHISEIDYKRINKIQDVIKPGDKVTVKLLGIDEIGKLRLSRKATLSKETVREHPPKRK